MAHVGSIIGGRFKVIDCIGKGGMGVVWLASDRTLGKYWAIKEIKITDGQSDRQKKIRIERLYSEAEMMKRLDHPAMPRIVDLITEASTLYVVMDYINGSSLDKELKRNGGPFDQDLVVSWAIQLCDVLSYLHAQNPPVIYRDMKPSNVMLCSDGSVRLIDFGIAREYKQEKSSDTQVLGTPDYAAPEQMSEEDQSDARSDIYSLGMTIYRLVTGVSSKDLAALRPLREINPKLSQGLENIVSKCTQRDPRLRYQTCEELRFDLERYEQLTDEHIAWQKGKVRRFRGAVAASVICIALGIGLFGLSNVVSAGQSLDLTQSARVDVKNALVAEAAGDTAGAAASWNTALGEYKSAKASDERTALQAMKNGAIQEWRNNTNANGAVSQEGFSQLSSLLRSMTPADAANNGAYASACFDLAQAWYWHAPESVTERKRAQEVYEWYAQAARYGIRNCQDYLDGSALNLSGLKDNGLNVADAGLSQDEAKAALVYAALTSYYAVSDEGVNNVYKKHWGNLVEVMDNLDSLGFESNTIKALSGNLVFSAIRNTDVLRSLKSAIVELNGGDEVAARTQVENLLAKAESTLDSLANDGSVDEFVKKAVALDGQDRNQAEQSIQAVFATLYDGTQAGGRS